MALLLAAALHALPARADTVADVQRLAETGQRSLALQKADEYLVARPKDPQMRFVKGVLLSDSGRGNEAIDVFRELTEDHPDLAEPYNNLAALLAAAGQFEQARSALEQAVRANPGYSTARENLGDVYAMLASLSYEQALKLEPANNSVPPKLALVRQLFAARAKTAP